MHRKPAALVHICGIIDFRDGISLTHRQAFFIARAKPFFAHIFTSKNEVVFVVFSLDIKAFVGGIEELHNLKLFFCVGVEAVHIITAFSAFFALPRDFVLLFFGYEIGFYFPVN